MGPPSAPLLAVKGVSPLLRRNQEGHPNGLTQDVWSSRNRPLTTYELSSDDPPFSFPLYPVFLSGLERDLRESQPAPGTRTRSRDVRALDDIRPLTEGSDGLEEVRGPVAVRHPPTRKERTTLRPPNRWPAPQNLRSPSVVTTKHQSALNLNFQLPQSLPTAMPENIQEHNA